MEVDSRERIIIAKSSLFQTFFI
jgi:hypothetical protein